MAARAYAKAYRSVPMSAIDVPARIECDPGRPCGRCCSTWLGNAVRSSPRAGGVTCRRHHSVGGARQSIGTALHRRRYRPRARARKWRPPHLRGIRTGGCGNDPGVRAVRVSGLAISRRIAKAMHGTIDIVSRSRRRRDLHLDMPMVRPQGQPLAFGRGHWPARKSWCCRPPRMEARALAHDLGGSRRDGSGGCIAGRCHPRARRRGRELGDPVPHDARRCRRGGTGRRRPGAAGRARRERRQCHHSHRAFPARPAAAFPDAGLRHLSCPAGAQRIAAANHAGAERIAVGRAPCHRIGWRALQRAPAFLLLAEDNDINALLRAPRAGKRPGIRWNSRPMAAPPSIA